VDLPATPVVWLKGSFHCFSVCCRCVALRRGSPQSPSSQLLATFAVRPRWNGNATAKVSPARAAGQACSVYPCPSAGWLSSPRRCRAVLLARTPEGGALFPKVSLAARTCLVFANCSFFFALFCVQGRDRIFFVAPPSGPCYIARASEILRLLPPSWITVRCGLSALQISGFSVFHSCGIRCEKPGGTGNDCAFSSRRNRAIALLVGPSQIYHGPLENCSIQA